MKIEVTVEKKHAFLIVGVILLVAGIFAVQAYGSSQPANVFGHTANELDPGIFGGGSGGKWAIPGKVIIGNGAQDSVGRNLLVNDTSAFAGVGISSNGAGGNTYIDFVKNGQVKANINWNDATFNINEKNTDTVINGLGGHVGLGPGVNVGSYAVSIAGTINFEGGTTYNEGRPFNLYVNSTSPMRDNTFLITLDVGDAQGPEKVIRLGMNTPFIPIGGFGSPWYSFCALTQVDNSGTGAAGCHIFTENGDWKLKAFRADNSIRVDCRAACIIAGGNG